MADGDELQGQTVGDCRLDRVLARGGMSVTWAAHHWKLDVPVVVKVLDPRKAWGRPMLVESFLREAKALGSIHHPHVVRVYSAGAQALAAAGGSSAAVPFLVLELVDGASLRARLRKGLERDAALELVRQAALGLGAAHGKGIVHGDVKPENVLVTDEDEAKVADFGLAQTSSDAHEAGASITVHGTPAYMAPEQCRGEPLDARADVYALGVMTFEVLLDRWPFNAPDARRLLQKHQTEAPPLKELRDAGVSRAVVELVGRCLSKDKDERPADGAAVAEALRAAMQADLTSSSGRRRRAGKPPPRRAKDGGGNATVVLTVVGLVIASAALAFIVSRT